MAKTGSGNSKAAEPPKKREKAAEGGFDKTGDDRTMQNHHRRSGEVRIRAASGHGGCQQAAETP